MRKYQKQPQFQHMFKILLIGNSGVGKSCILTRFSENQFVSNFYNTIGVDFKIKFIKLDNKVIKLQIWDTAGQDRFRTITNTYYRGANGIIIVYDITDRESFQNVKNWYSEIDKNSNQNVAKVLVGNKKDMEDRRRVTFQQGVQLSNFYKIPFLQTSAKNDSNIEAVFQNLGHLIMDRLDPQALKATKTKLKPPRPITQKSVQNDSCCC